jgi:hypothetical protein
MPLLEQRRERFCQLVTSGKSDLAAYQEAYQCDYATAQSNAWRLRENEGVVDRIQALQSRIEDKTVLTLIEKRRFLAQVVRTPIGEVDEQSPLCQEVTYDDKGGMKRKMVGKLEALKLDAMLAKELGDASTVVNVQMIALRLDMD